MANKVWLITGAGRGMGVDITKEALAAGHQVIATGRIQPDPIYFGIRYRAVLKRRNCSSPQWEIWAESQVGHGFHFLF